MDIRDQKGKVVRWTSNNWGIANYYINGELDPRKVFVHISKVIGNTKPIMGSRIIFDVGPARNPNELPQALNVKVINCVEAL